MARAALVDLRYCGEASPASCSGPAPLNSARYSSSVCLRARVRGRRVASGGGSIGEEVTGLLHVGQEDLRMPLQHFVQGGRAALLVPDNEEIGHGSLPHEAHHSPSPLHL